MAFVKVKRRVIVAGGVAGLKKRVGKDGLLVEVGLKDTGPSYPSGTKVKQAALYNINGTAKIPRRDFITGFIKRLSGKYVSLTSGIIKSLLRGKASYDTAARLLGVSGQKDMRGLIKGWSDPPNAPSTVARKGRNDPLVHTGKLMHEIGWWRVL